MACHYHQFMSLTFGFFLCFNDTLLKEKVNEIVVGFHVLMRSVLDLCSCTYGKTDQADHIYIDFLSAVCYLISVFILGREKRSAT